MRTLIQLLAILGCFAFGIFMATKSYAGLQGSWLPWRLVAPVIVFIVASGLGIRVFEFVGIVKLDEIGEKNQKPDDTPDPAPAPLVFDSAVSAVEIGPDRTRAPAAASAARGAAVSAPPGSPCVEDGAFGWATAQQRAELEGPWRTLVSWSDLYEPAPRDERDVGVHLCWRDAGETLEFAILADGAHDRSHRGPSELTYLEDGRLVQHTWPPLCVSKADPDVPISLPGPMRAHRGRIKAVVAAELG